MRALAVLAASLVFCGCFVFDEIDAGQKEMDRYDKNKTTSETAEPGKAKSETASPQERAKQWWNSARTFAPREDDAKSNVVSCKLGGKVRYMSQTDCQNSGGRVAGS